MCVYYTKREVLTEDVIAYKVVYKVTVDGRTQFFSEYHPERRAEQAQIDVSIENPHLNYECPFSTKRNLYIGEDLYSNPGEYFEYLIGYTVKSEDPGIYCYTDRNAAELIANHRQGVLEMLIPKGSAVAWGKREKYNREENVVSAHCVRVLAVLPRSM